MVSRDGRSAAHSFIYKVRADLTAAEVNALNAQGKKANRGFVPHAEDVFGLVKGRTHHTQTQSPVLVLPRAILQRVGTATPEAVLRRPPLEGAMKANLLKLARLVRSMPQPYLRAATEMESLAAEAEPEAPPVLGWLGHGPPARSPVSPTRNAYYEHLPDTSWNLLATFHRKV